MTEDLNFGIWPPYEAFYIHAMLFSTKTALHAVQTANYALNRAEEWVDDPEKAISDWDLILDNIQTVVSCGAALSRYFWPARKRSPHKQRARRLRESLSVDANSPLRNRDLRNIIEHFDERLDLYVADGVVGHILPVYIGARPEEPEIPTHLFRAYYTEVAVFEVLGERFEINPIVKEIARIHDALTSCSENGSVLPRNEG